MNSKLQKIIDILNEHYGEKSWERWRKPIDELVRTLLSHNTTDTNSLKAFANLREKYSDWNELLNADQDEIAEVIRVGGLANSKAKKIKNSLAEIKKREGKLELEFLADYELKKAIDYLSSLDGVGPKTAACVLIFSFNFPYMPVDTHIHRVSNRLGIVDEKSREKSQEQLNELIPEEDMYSFHLNIIEHGRKICKARKPRCSECFLTEICDYFQSKKE